MCRSIPFLFIPYNDSMVQRVSTGIILFLAAALSSCGKKETHPAQQPQLPESRPTYTAGIKTLVESRCAISGCHDGHSGIIGFTGYSPLKERADNGRIESFVFELKIMPPASATALTEDEKKLLQCWLDNGAPEH